MREGGREGEGVKEREGGRIFCVQAANEKPVTVWLFGPP